MKVLFQFHIIFRNRQNGMFVDLVSKSCEEGEEFLYWVTKMSQYFEDEFFQTCLNIRYLLRLFPVRQTHRIRNASFLLALFGKCKPEDYYNDYLSSHVHTLHIQAVYKHT